MSLIVDFEDAVTYAAAEESRVDLIVTRNIDDFLKGNIRAVLPDVFVKSFRSP